MTIHQGGARHALSADRQSREFLLFLLYCLYKFPCLQENNLTPVNREGLKRLLRGFKEEIRFCCSLPCRVNRIPVFLICFIIDFNNTMLIIFI
jgi:hypothetical protein